MRMMTKRLSRLSASGVAVLLLVALLALALGIEGSQPFHSHEDGHSGIYNSECPLASLAAIHTEGPVPGVDAAGWVPLLPLEIEPATSRGIDLQLVRSAQSRAPPLT
jgi:hypothetical protein